MTTPIIREKDPSESKRERSLRKIKPTGKITFGSNEWHPEKQWLLDAEDIEKSTPIKIAYRTFAMKDIHSWKAISTEEIHIRLESDL